MKDIKSIYIVGVGLIGGSIARDIRCLNPNIKLYGIDKNEAHLETALKLGIIDEKAVLEDVVKAQVVIVAIPVDATVVLLPEILDLIPDEALVMESGSTKLEICNAVAQHPKRRNFMATHPIAGTEFSGPKAAYSGLFKGKVNIICEVEKTAFKFQKVAMAIFNIMGMQIRYMDPASHDKHIAYVSHLSHISAFMLGKTVMEKEKNERDIFDMAGSGFASTVRLAKSSPDMWAPIFQQNKANIIETLEEYIKNLKTFKNFMEANAFDAIYQDMKNTNYIKHILNGKE
ncbi:prephenate dehydrogenase [Mangrovimonas yunxiaonensis]|nr:prephenate dehydrogenase [Mangrovimonas yunxiaonensis]